MFNMLKSLNYMFTIHNKTLYQLSFSRIHSFLFMPGKSALLALRNTNAKNTEGSKLVVKFVIPKSAASMILGPRGATWQANAKETGPKPEQ